MMIMMMMMMMMTMMMMMMMIIMIIIIIITINIIIIVIKFQDVGGERELIIIYRYTVTTRRIFRIKMDSDVSHFESFIHCAGQSNDTVSINHNYNVHKPRL